MCTVLVIDDDESILIMLRQALTNFGYKVETASGGKEGINKFDHGVFDIVITDIHMPDIDGNDVAIHIRNSHRHFIPIIAISGTPWLLDGKAFDIILQKPFPIKRLFDIIRNLTEKSPSLNLLENQQSIA